MVQPSKPEATASPTHVIARGAKQKQRRLENPVRSRLRLPFGVEALRDT